MSGNEKLMFFNDMMNEFGYQIEKRTELEQMISLFDRLFIPYKYDREEGKLSIVGTNFFFDKNGEFTDHFINGNEETGDMFYNIIAGLA